MAQVTFAPCPAGTVQYRNVWRVSDDTIRGLWRHPGCNPERWHYRENPCNCVAMGGVTQDWLQRVCGFKLERAVPERGTWRRDGFGIAAQLANFRAALARTTAHEKAVAAAKGPQRVSDPFLEMLTESWSPW